MKCAHCTKHEATIKWVGEGGFMAFVHGHYEEICSCCSIRAQLAHASAMAARIPELLEALKTACREYDK